MHPAPMCRSWNSVARGRQKHGGSCSAATSGQAVNEIEWGHFVVADTGLVLHSIDATDR
jgi:hypothetical protein